MRVALLTCGVLPDPDPDEAPLLQELARRGHDARPAVWDDPAEDFSEFDMLLLRATWDYADKADSFANWLRRPEIATRIWNTSESVLWNLNKAYLLELESCGIPIVPTALIPAGDPFDLLEIVERFGSEGIVVKPAVSAGSARTRLFESKDLEGATEFLRSWHHESAAMVQPYVRSVEGGIHGTPERAIVWIDGEITHAVEKSRRFAGDEESVRALEKPSSEMVHFVEQTIEACGHDLLYARIDVMDGPDGSMMLSELELIEPSLFFELGAGSVQRYVDAIENRAATS